ncbi:hypothetical protein [Xanthomonas sp. 3058]|uniref:hypothetical protein n=1 Tax=Xanthomonas sp. 3058 TaxID=3035314 RepID=UPI0016136DCA|nr:hypothetical protein [Xanthomonas sp. 3058]MBB5866205.1 hypothetical protein [Xanthomonas sp. 3058]
MGSDTMIGEHDLGQMLSVFALSYSDDLFETSFLNIQEKRLFRSQCRLALDTIPDAVFHPDIHAWSVDWTGIALSFRSSYFEAAPQDDGNALRGWIKNGYNGIYSPDLLPHLWDSTLHWAKHDHAWAKHLDAARVERTQAFLWKLSHERRSDKHIAILEAVRNHDDTRVDERIKEKVHLDFHDDFVDPLLLFTCMRGQFIFLQCLKEHCSDSQLMETLNLLPEAWVRAEGYKYKDHDYNGVAEHASIAGWLDD